MTYFDTQQQGPWQFNPQQWAMFNPQGAQSYGAWLGTPAMHGLGHGLGGPGLGSPGLGHGQAAYGQQWGQYGQPPIGAFGMQPQWFGGAWGQPRQLSQYDVNEVVRQLLPALPHILAQAQQPQFQPHLQPHLGYAAYGQGYHGQGYGGPRMLTPQDVNEVVRQLLPIVPQILGSLQSQPHLQYAAMHGGMGGFGPGQFGQGIANPFAPHQQLGQYGWPQFQSAFGGHQHLGQQRQLTQQDVADVTRQLVTLIPQVIGNLQAYNQPRMI